MQDHERRTGLRRRLRKILAVAANLAALPIAAAWPRSRRQWVFGHEGDVFAGNPKYLFLWIAAYRPDLRATWLTGSDATRRMLLANGYAVRMRWSAGGMLAALRARTFVFAHDVADVAAPLSWGATRLNLWHGVGLKAMQVARARGRRLRGWLRGLLFIPYDRVVTTSDLMQAHFAAQFELPPDRCPQLGYPRLDCAADERLRDAARRIDARLDFAVNPGGFAEIYIYLPTHRDSHRPFLQRAVPDVARLTDILRRRNALLYVKVHPRTAETVTYNSHLRRWPPQIDFYAYMDCFDLLITDYSSVLYDFIAIRDTGLLLYTFDYDEYVAEDRVLLHGFEENIAGLRIGHFDDLCATLRDGAALGSADAMRVQAVRQRFWGGSGQPASKAIVDYVMAAPASGGPARHRKS